jgi:hypothetical protein
MNPGKLASDFLWRKCNLRPPADLEISVDGFSVVNILSKKPRYFSATK